MVLYASWEYGTIVLETIAAPTVTTLFAGHLRPSSLNNLAPGSSPNRFGEYSVLLIIGQSGQGVSNFTPGSRRPDFGTAGFYIYIYIHATI